MDLNLIVFQLIAVQEPYNFASFSALVAGEKSGL